MAKKTDEYIVYARKWRPQTFDEVIGQEHTSKTLKNSIEKGRIAHAFLFKGPKGVGKTSMARIFAKAVNCDTGPTPNPCNKCPHCLGITNGTEIDVLEIDGASNTGVDNIRELRENVNYSPTSCRYKIYIIDEVHMLSTGAFNALLKTLEEPPKRVIFIFATTDPEKIPQTIVSRCNVFDFKRIEKQDIIKRLEHIIKEEKEIEIEASEKELILSTIADNSDGSMRDAEVLLDQAVSFGMGKVTLENLNSLLGLTDSKILYETFEMIASRNTNGLLLTIDELYKRGKNLEVFTKSLIQYVRDLILIKVASRKNNELIRRPESDIVKMQELITKFSYPELIRISNIFLDTEGKLKTLTQSRFVLELAFIKLTTFDPFINVETLIAKASSAGVTSTSTPTSASKKEDEFLLPLSYDSPKREIPQNQAVEEQKIKSPKSQHSVYDIKDDSADTSIMTEEELLESEEEYNSPQPPLEVKSEADELFNQLIKVTREKRTIINSHLEKLKPLEFKNNSLYIGVPKSQTFTKKKLEKPETKNFLEYEISAIYNKPCKIIFQFVEDSEETLKKNSDTIEPKEQPKKQTRGEVIKSNPIIKKALELFPDGKFINNH